MAALGEGGRAGPQTGRSFSATYAATNFSPLVDLPLFGHHVFDPGRRQLHLGIQPGLPVPGVPALGNGCQVIIFLCISCVLVLRHHPQHRGAHFSLCQVRGQLRGQTSLPPPSLEGEPIEPGRLSLVGWGQFLPCFWKSCHHGGMLRAAGSVGGATQNPGPLDHCQREASPVTTDSRGGVPDLTWETGGERRLHSPAKGPCPFNTGDSSQRNQRHPSHGQQ